MELENENVYLYKKERGKKRLKGKYSTKTKSNRTKAMNEWLKNEKRETLRFTDYFGNTAEITAQTRCVPAIHTVRSKQKVNGRYRYTYGSAMKYHAVSENGYMLSFDNPSGIPSVVGSNTGKDYINTGTSDTEKLYRVVWFSFAMNAIRTRNFKEIPRFVIVDKGRLETRESISLTVPKLKKLLRMPSHSYHELNDGRQKKVNPRKNMPKQYTVHHIDTDPRNNALGNLELLPWWAHDCAPNSFHKRMRELERRINHKLKGGHVTVVDRYEIDKFWGNILNGTMSIAPYKGYYIVQVNEPDHAPTTEEWESARDTVIELYKLGIQMDSKKEGRVMEVVLENNNVYQIQAASKEE